VKARLDRTPREAVVSLDRTQTLEIRDCPQAYDLGDMSDAHRSFARTSSVSKIVLESRRKLRDLFMEECRIKDEPLVADAKAGALFANAAFSHHRDDVTARHRVHEHRPLLERGTNEHRVFIHMGKMQSRQTLQRLTSTILFTAAIAAPASAQLDGLVMLPNNYRKQFENEWVRVVHVHVAPNEALAPHSHPPGLMLHVYLNDADPIQFDHGGPPGLVTRPPVKSRSYRIGRATPETHSVLNTSATASDYLRVELKTQGDDSPRRRVAAPPLGTENASVVEVDGVQFRATRVTIGAGQTTEIAAGAMPSIVIALTEGITAEQTVLKLGQERFIEAGKRVSFTSGVSPTQLLKVDFLTRPQ